MKKVLFTTLNENNLPPNSAEIEKRPKALKSDRMLLVILFILLILGTIMIASASFPYANSHYNDGSYYIKRQIVFLAIGIATMILQVIFRYDFIKKSRHIFI
jgi:cell division protein FtsW